MHSNFPCEDFHKILYMEHLHLILLPTLKWENYRDSVNHKKASRFCSTHWSDVSLALDCKLGYFYYVRYAC